EIHHVARRKIWIAEQFLRGLAVIPLEPQAATHALKATTRFAEAFGTIRPDREVSDLARPAICAPPDLAVSVDAAANAGRQRHVEERRVSFAGAECGFGQCASVSVIVHEGGH